MARKGSFASRELEKHGWNSGQGLGKLENGMKEAIKVKVKNNTSGLGHDHGAEFTFHWWDHVFNKTANSIKVTSDGNCVKIEKDKNAKKITPVLVSNKKPLQSCFVGKPLLYGTFVKSGTFDASGGVSSNEEDSSTDDISNDEDMSIKDTLEKTYKMTGFTGHKAARHGHQLSGKLKRIQEQEKSDVNINTLKNSICESDIGVKKKKDVKEADELTLKKTKYASEEDKKILKKKKKRKNKDDNDEDKLKIKSKKQKKIQKKLKRIDR